MAENSVPESAAEKLPDNPDWMSKLPESLLGQPLTTIAIPGSHDSFTHNLDVNGPLGPDCTNIIRELCKIFGPTAKHIILRWSLTQTYSFTEQLQAGIRYFDLRVSTKAGTSDLYFLHGLYGDRVEDGLVELNNYLDQHPQEVVLLDFNHFYTVSAEAHANLIQRILAIFKRKLCPRCSMSDLTLHKLWEAGRQVLIFYHSQVAASYEYLWPGQAIPSPWGNTVSQTALLQFLERNYERGRPADTFYVTQGVLTPDTKYIIEHLRSSLKTQLAAKMAQPFTKWLQAKTAGSQGINICIMDYVEFADYIDAVISLNKPKS